MLSNSYLILEIVWKKKKIEAQEFPGGPVVKTPCFQGKGHGLIPGQGTKIPQGQKKKKMEKEKKKKSLHMMMPFNGESSKFSLR